MSNQLNDKLVFQLSARVDFKYFDLDKDETGVTFKPGQEIKSERSFTVLVSDLFCDLFFCSPPSLHYGR